MKRYIAALLALIMILSLTACGGKGEDITGKYLCVGEAYGDSPLGEPTGECWLELKKGGKGTYYADVAFDLEWEVDGEAFTGTISFWAMEDEMTGTLKDGVVDVTCADKTMRFVKEGMQDPSISGESSAASGESESSAPLGNGESIVFDGIAGYYPVSGAVFDGEEWTILDLRAFEMADGVFLQLNADGTGELAFENGKTNPITYDEAAGTITYADGTALQFTVEGETISVGYFDEASNSDVTMRYTRDPNVAPAADGATGASAAIPFDFGNVAVASSMEDAFAGYAASGFISPTTAIELGSIWYGTMLVTDFVGADTEDYSKDIVAVIKATGSGDEYLEVYASIGNDTSYINNENIVLSLYVTVDGDHLTPIIGYQDAWISQRYLTEADAAYFTPYLENGAIDIIYPYEDPNGRFTNTIRLFLREDGAPWDEANDPLPPSYEEYKASLDN